MTLRDKLNNLSSEQQKKLLAVETEADLEAALAELGIEASPEEKAAVLEQISSFAARELSDDEAGKAGGGLTFYLGELGDDEAERVAGGAFFQKCPHGKYEDDFYKKESGCESCTHYRFYVDGMKLHDGIKDVVYCYYFNKAVYLAK